MYWYCSAAAHFVGPAQISGYEPALAGGIGIYHMRKLRIVAYEREARIFAGGANPEVGI